VSHPPAEARIPTLKYPIVPRLKLQVAENVDFAPPFEYLTRCGDPAYFSIPSEALYKYLRIDSGILESALEFLYTPALAR
jgi:hypothetical protein